jgi:hypothetical protein
MLMDAMLLAFGLMDTVAFAYLSYQYSFTIYGVFFNFEAFIVCSVCKMQIFLILLAKTVSN